MRKRNEKSTLTFYKSNFWWQGKTNKKHELQNEKWSFYKPKRSDTGTRVWFTKKERNKICVKRMEKFEWMQSLHLMAFLIHVQSQNSTSCPATNLKCKMKSRATGTRVGALRPSKTTSTISWKKGGIDIGSQPFVGLSKKATFQQTTEHWLLVRLWSLHFAWTSPIYAADIPIVSWCQNFCNAKTNGDMLWTLAERRKERMRERERERERETGRERVSAG